MALSSPGVIGVAQSGRYAPGETDLKISSWKVNNITGCTRLRQGFGEAGVAIDRFPGKVLDKQIEVVNE